MEDTWRLLTLLLLYNGLTVTDSAEVTRIDPFFGSTNGGTRVTIYGSGFAANQFNWGSGNENLGNEVTIISGTQSYKTEIHKDGCTEDQIQFYTPPLPAGKYGFQVKVDGKIVTSVCAADSSKCVFETIAWATPTVESVYPRSGTPGTLLTVKGRIITTRYGSNIAESDNGKEEKLLRVYAPQGYQCEMKAPGSDEFYGIGLNSETSVKGYFTCKTTGTYVTSANISFIVEGKYGRSLPVNDVLKYSGSNAIQMFQTYAVISSVTPSFGSTSGGTKIKLTGQFFNNTEKPLRVEVGGKPCTNLKLVSDTEMTCDTPPQPASQPFYTGNRGLLYEAWTSTAKNYGTIDEILTLDSSAADYNSTIIDETYFSDSSNQSFVSRLSGIFIPSHNSSYRFFIKCDDYAVLYFSETGNPADKQKIANCSKFSTSYTRSEQASALMTLTAGKKYYLMILHGEHLLGAFAQVGVKMFTSPVTNAECGSANQEQQTVSVSSTVVDEVQTVSLSGFNSLDETYTPEKQTVVVSNIGGNEQITFRLGLYGVFTGPLKASSDATAIEAALNLLPVIAPDTVSISTTAGATSNTFVITFNSALGDIPLLETKIDVTGSSLTVTASDNQNGVAGGKNVRFSMNGNISPAFTYGGSAADVKTAVEGLFSVRCPSTFVGGDNKYFQDFENQAAVKAMGEIISYVTPFCGRHSIKNPKYVYEAPETKLGISLSQYGVVCFAYLGPINPVLGVTYKFYDKTTLTTSSATNYLTIANAEASTTWNYVCVNVVDELSKLKPDGSSFEARKLVVYRNNSAVDPLLVDAVIVVRSSLATDTKEGILGQRLVGSTPGGFPMKTLKVEDNAGVYTITMSPNNCSYEIPLLGLANAKASQTDLVKSTSASFSATTKAGGTITMTTSRTSAASPPVTGSVGVSFEGKSVDIPTTAEEREVRDLLMTIPNIGNLYVKKEGDCAKFTWQITWLSRTGDLPEATVDGSKLSGMSPTASIKTDVNGGLWYDPIPGDMLRTYETTPQVIAYVNDIPTRCEGSCGFEWKSTSTPSVTAISPSSDFSGATLTITGTSFGATPADNTVTIGGVDCPVTTASSTQLVCTLGAGTGTHDVEVNVAGVGLASGSHTFTYNTRITSIAPTSGSLAGGTLLKVSGSGFSPTAVVTINSDTCTKVTATTSEIVCLTPSASTPGSASVTLTQTGTTLTATQQFNYDTALTANIATVSPTSSSVTGGGTLVLEGTGFGASQPAGTTLVIGGEPATITSYSDTRVEATFPAQAAGNHAIKFTVGNNGYAAISSSTKSIAYSLKVTHIFPRSGSLYGGTVVTVTGQGFGNTASHIKASFGGHACDVVGTVTDTQFKCQIAATGKVHQVTNQGTSSVYGVGYAWSPMTLDANVGDFIEWKWSVAAGVSGINIGVYQTDTAVATTSSGFSSGAAVPSGMYKYQVTKTRDVFYWSDYVDAKKEITFRGAIKVTPRPQSVEDFTLKLSGYEAEYDTASGVSDPAASACELISAISGCTESPATGGTAGKFHFSFETCRSPSVSSVSHDQGHAVQDVTLAGSGFGVSGCQHKIDMGDFTCSVSSASAGSLVCNVDGSTKPQVGVMKEVQVSVVNRGFALMATPKVPTFVLLPHVSSYSPQEGSLKGGFTLTINGGGFNADTVVTIDAITCEITSVTYDTITCVAPSLNTYSSKALVVKVPSNGNNLEAKCSDPLLSCSIRYAQASTPTVTSVTPDSVSGSSTMLTIVGTLFGTTSSGVTVTIGGAPCTISSVTDTQIQCTVGTVPVGSQDVSVVVDGVGKATTAIKVQSEAVLTSISPNTGSTNGGTLVTIAGNGFVTNKTTVTIGGNACDLKTVTSTSIECTTPAGTGAATVAVVSNGVTYASLTYTYDSSATPTITSISPSSGNPGQTLTITGTGFVSGMVKVAVGDTDCTVTSSTSTQIECTLGASSAGARSVLVDVTGQGVSDKTNQFTYSLALGSISPSSGSLGGGQTVTITGHGFSSKTGITICGKPCPLDSSATQTQTQYVCFTPTNAAGSCDVVATEGSETDTLAASYTYDSSVTPTITSVNPNYGGTAGGTSVTVTGSGFGTNAAAVSVKIGGVTCAIDTITDTSLTCTTGARSGSIDTAVALQVATNGIADQTNAAFRYLDVWSSSTTWMGGTLPEEGEMVVIQENQTILLDVSTPILGMLLIQGGKVIFDEKDIELNAKYILITNNGALQVGQEGAPFQHTATITMHGVFRSPELPIYGSKSLGVREGTLDLHGKPKVTWTRLASTATAGSTTLTLQQAVDWEVGDKIVIATTGHRHSQEETETRRVAAVSADGLTVTLDSALTYTHVRVTETYGSTTVDMAGEVGLLSHNVRFRGYGDPEWVSNITKCEAGFDTGEFATQTCFQGRFGDEMGSDEFGAHILVHAPKPDLELAIARIEYVELTHVGQAFRLGRYPIHLHLNGDMKSSYVRGCGLHKTFNRAVNVHKTHNLRVEHNVIYNVMGGSFFLEDGIETGNFFQYNLATFVRASSSLLNDDITPACFWVTNPNNTIQHNAAAGGTHFGFWYRMHEHPDGPSFDPNICPRHVPLGVFQNNTAHSMGWFGLWIFQEYHPRVGGSCSTTADHEVAVFKSLTVWNCEKGAEAVNVGALQFHQFIMVHNEKAGYEGKLIKDSPQYDEATSYAVKDSVMVANSPGLTAVSGQKDYCTIGGIVLPYGNGMYGINIEFHNFARSGCNSFTYTKIDGTCSEFCGGYTYKFRQISFTNSPNRGKFDWKWQAVMIDEDGSLSGGAAGSQVTPTSDTLPPSCTSDSNFNKGVPASLCPGSLTFHRVALNNIQPVSLEAQRMILNNSYGIDYSDFHTKRISHKPGWIGLLIDGETYRFSWEGGEKITNISYHATFYQFGDVSNNVKVCQRFERQPDRFSLDGKTFRNATTSAMVYGTNKNGDWEFSQSDMELCFLVSGKKSRRRKRGSGAMPIYAEDVDSFMTAFKCYYTGCVPPPDPDTIPPTCTRPSNATKWSDLATWQTAEAGWGGNLGNGLYGLPKQGDKVKIPKGYWVILDQAIPSFTELVIEGTLELDHGPTKDNDITIDVTYLYIRGGRLIIGCEESAPYEGKASIVLRGTASTTPYPVTEGPNVGSKVIGVFGGLDLHGKNHTATWTTLSQTADSGANQITLTDAVDWAVNDEIVITATSYKAWEVEIRKISAVSADKKTLTLNATLANKHISMEETFSNGEKYSMRAEVGLLTRNIRIIGAEYPEMFTESYGARVLVGVTADATRRYTGFARISNVEFYRGGQEGYTATYDPRHALSFVDIPISHIKPCYVKHSSFHHNLGIALGVYGTNNLEIQGNVIYHTIGSAIHTKSAGTAIRNNLISLNIWPGTYNGRSESQNIYYDGSVDAIGAADTVLQGNAISSSERSGYHGDFESCTATDTWFDNVFHSNLMAVGIFPIDKVNPPTCWRIANMTIWKNYNFGVYYQSQYEVSMEKLTVVDNNVGIFPMVLGPPALDHLYQNKKITISKSLIVGKSSVFDCANDKMDFSLPYFTLRRTFDKSWRIGTAGRIGIGLTIFSSGPNNSPEKPFIGIMAYNAIAGFTTITDTTFANFQTGSSGECGQDVAITSDPNNDDACHPTELSGNRKFNVGDENTVYYHRPRLAKINPADCVDFDCDGLKKCLVEDKDGSMLGTVGTVVPQSEFEWDGDPRRGLGDYRIPKPLLTDPSGAVKTVAEVAKYKGILRDNTCTYNDKRQSYLCTAYNYKQLTIENMDADTEIRRLSPVAVLGWNDNGDGYIDLINGPQDHGWCAGYTCQKRLSTFQAITPIGRNYSLYFTSNSPQHLRLMMLNTPNKDRIRVGAYNSKPNRLDVYVNGDYKLPKNGQLDSNKNLILQQATSVGEFNPKVDSDPCGTNYMDRDWQELQVIVCGGDEVEIKMSPQIVVGFNIPTMTVDQFFGPNLLNNLATFLGISSDKIRTMQVQSGVSRRKRSTGTNTMYYIEVGNPPCTDINCTSAVSVMTYTDQQALASKIINQYQLGNLSDILNITINGVAVAEALPPTSDPNWATVVSSSNYQNAIRIPEVMEFQTTLTAGTEGNAFPVQPVLQFRESNPTTGDRITLLGASSHPWKVEVSLRSGSGSNPSATLIGNTTVSFIDGYANFSGLGISHSGSGYILDFKVIDPTEATFTLASAAISVAERLLTSAVTYTSPDIYHGSAHTVTLDIRDKTSGATLTDIAWSGLNWYANISLVTGLTYTGSMTSTATKAFDPVTGLVTVNDLQMDTVGMAHVKFTVYSVPTHYSHEVIHELSLYPTEAQSVTIDTTSAIKVKFDLDYATYGTTQFGAVIVNYFQSRFKYMKMSSLEVSQGSVIVAVTVSGNSTTVLEVTEAMCDAIKSGTSFTYQGTSVQLSKYMTVNGASYCSDEDDDDEEVKALMIVGICVAILMIILIIAAIMVWRLKVYPKTKTHRASFAGKLPGMHSDGDAVYIGKGKGTFFFEDSFYRQDTFNSLRTENSFLEGCQKPPINTTFYEKEKGNGGSALSRHF